MILKSIGAQMTNRTRFRGSQMGAGWQPAPIPGVSTMLANGRKPHNGYSVVQPPEMLDSCTCHGCHGGVTPRVEHTTESPGRLVALLRRVIIPPLYTGPPPTPRRGGTPGDVPPSEGGCITRNVGGSR